jgi:hypothetical protein
MKEVLSSSETSVLTRATRRNIPEDAILHSYRGETSDLTKFISFWNMLYCVMNWHALQQLTVHQLTVLR